MNLVIDIGNFRTKLAFFEGDDLLYEDSFRYWDTTKVYKHLKSNSKIMISKVSDRHDRNLDLLAQRFQVQYLSNKTKLPIVLDYKTPDSLGIDRIALVVAANKLFPNQHSLVIDAGTCITYDFIDKEGVYRGGQISPGLQMRLNAMHSYTANLPQLTVQDSFEPIGKSTLECMMSGALLGTINELEGFIKSYNSTFGKINICITGGDTQFFVLNMKTEILAFPFLVLQGLNEILNFNA